MMADFVEYKNEGVWHLSLREKIEQSAQCKLCKTKLKSVGVQLKAFVIVSTTKLGTHYAFSVHTMVTCETRTVYDVIYNNKRSQGTVSDCDIN